MIILGTFSPLTQIYFLVEYRYRLWNSTGLMVTAWSFIGSFGKISRGWNKSNIKLGTLVDCPHRLISWLLLACCVNSVQSFSEAPFPFNFLLFVWMFWLWVYLSRQSKRPQQTKLKTSYLPPLLSPPHHRTDQINVVSHDQIAAKRAEYNVKGIP